VYELIFYEDKDGNKPVELFIDQLEAIATSNKNARVLLESIIYCLDRLEDGGTRCGSKFGMGITWYCFINSEKKQIKRLHAKSK
jgi:hypothetical protein